MVEKKIDDLINIPLQQSNYNANLFKAQANQKQVKRQRAQFNCNDNFQQQLTKTKIPFHKFNVNPLTKPHNVSIQPLNFTINSESNSPFKFTTKIEMGNL